MEGLVAAAAADANGRIGFRRREVDEGGGRDRRREVRRVESIV